MKELPPVTFLKTACLMCNFSRFTYLMIGLCFTFLLLVPTSSIYASEEGRGDDYNYWRSISKDQYPCGNTTGCSIVRDAELSWAKWNDANKSMIYKKTSSATDYKREWVCDVWVPFVCLYGHHEWYSKYVSGETHDIEYFDNISPTVVVKQKDTFKEVLEKYTKANCTDAGCQFSAEQCYIDTARNNAVHCQKWDAKFHKFYECVGDSCIPQLSKKTVSLYTATCSDDQ